MGRPTKLDDLLAKRIVDAVSCGLPWKLAAQAAGIGWSTLKEWKAKGRAGEAPYAAFLARLEEAEAKHAHAAMAMIMAAATDPKHWTAAAWALERRHPELFALKRVIEPEAEAVKEQAADDLEVARSVVAALESKKAANDG